MTPMMPQSPTDDLPSPYQPLPAPMPGGFGGGGNTPNTFAQQTSLPGGLNGQPSNTGIAGLPNQFGGYGGMMGGGRDRRRGFSDTRGGFGGQFGGPRGGFGGQMGGYGNPFGGQFGGYGGQRGGGFASFGDVQGGPFGGFGGQMGGYGNPFGGQFGGGMQQGGYGNPFGGGLAGLLGGGMQQGGYGNTQPNQQLQALLAARQGQLAPGDNRPEAQWARQQQGIYGQGQLNPYLAQMDPNASYNRPPPVSNPTPYTGNPIAMQQLTAPSGYTAPNIAGMTQSQVAAQGQQQPMQPMDQPSPPRDIQDFSRPDIYRTVDQGMAWQQPMNLA